MGYRYCKLPYTTRSERMPQAQLRCSCNISAHTASARPTRLSLCFSFLLGNMLRQRPTTTLFTRLRVWHLEPNDFTRCSWRQGTSEPLPKWAVTGAWLTSKCGASISSPYNCMLCPIHYIYVYNFIRDQMHPSKSADRYPISGAGYIPPHHLPRHDTKGMHLCLPDAS